MPFSHSSQISAILGYLESKQPKSILDIGVGMGQYGFLARTNLEHFNLYEVINDTARRRDKAEWDIIIDGVEAYPGYLTPVHDYSYNKIYVGDALEVIPNLSTNYDMVLAIDILEHFEKAWKKISDFYNGVSIIGRSPPNGNSIVKSGMPPKIRTQILKIKFLHEKI